MITHLWRNLCTEYNAGEGTPNLGLWCQDITATGWPLVDLCTFLLTGVKCPLPKESCVLHHLPRNVGRLANPSVV